MADQGSASQVQPESFATASEAIDSTRHLTHFGIPINKTSNTDASENNASAITANMYTYIIPAIVIVGAIMTMGGIYFMIFKKQNKKRVPIMLEGHENIDNTTFNMDKKQDLAINQSTDTLPVFSVQNSPNFTPYSPIDVIPTIPYSPQPQLLPENLSKLKI